jgi:hypothetical protein
MMGEGRVSGQRGWVAIGVVILLAAFALQARRGSQTCDEGRHTFAAYSYWTRGDCGVNPEHPPLVKLLASLPLLGLSLRVPADQNRGFKVETNLNGQRIRL